MLNTESVNVSFDCVDTKTRWIFFYNILMDYPLSQKLPASTLKLGQIRTTWGDHEKARMMFDRVIDQYPGSSEAELAQQAVEAAVKSEQSLQESD